MRNRKKESDEMSRKPIMLLSLLVVFLIGSAIWFLFYYFSSDDTNIKPTIPPAQQTKSISSQTDPPVSNQDIKLSEQVARTFLKEYIRDSVEFDRIKDYITPYWYHQMKAMHRFKRKTARVQSYNLVSVGRGTSEVTATGIIWIFEVREQVMDIKGHQTIEEKVYTLQLIKGLTWKVDEVDVYGTFD